MSWIHYLYATKKCDKCSDTKYLKNFPFISNKRGHRISAMCQECLGAKKERSRINKTQYYKRAKKSTIEKRKIYQKEYRIKNRDKCVEKRKQCKLNLTEKLCVNCFFKKSINSFKTKNGIIRKQCNNCRDLNSEVLKKLRNEKRRETRKPNNPELVKKWRQENKDYLIKFLKNKRETDPLFKLTCHMRSVLNSAFKIKNWDKAKKTKEILGCDFKFLKQHIESQFKPGMSWDKRTDWHIDHKVPLSTAKTSDELIKLNHYSNLQPLWKLENLQKGTRVN